jgi:hypothetical protein
VFAVVSAYRGLLIVEHAQLEEGAAEAKGLELGGEVGKLGARGGGSHGNILNLWGAGGLWWGIGILQRSDSRRLRILQATDSTQERGHDDEFKFHRFDW